MIKDLRKRFTIKTKVVAELERSGCIIFCIDFTKFNYSIEKIQLWYRDIPYNAVWQHLDQLEHREAIQR